VDGGLPVIFDPSDDELYSMKLEMPGVNVVSKPSESISPASSMVEGAEPTWSTWVLLP
jgi:hypothetical protein